MQPNVTQPASSSSMSATTNASNSVTPPMHDDGVDDDDVHKQIESMKQFIDKYGNAMLAEGKKRANSFANEADKCNKMTKNIREIWMPILAQVDEEIEEAGRRRKRREAEVVEEEEEEGGDQEKETREADVVEEGDGETETGEADAVEDFADTTIIPTTSSPSSSTSSTFWVNSPDVAIRDPWSSESMSSTPPNEEAPRPAYRKRRRIKRKNLVGYGHKRRRPR